jgi:hypothetical protein
MSTLVLRSKLPKLSNVIIALKSLISPSIPSTATCTSIHLPGVRSTSLCTRPLRQIRWYCPPDQPMSSQLRTLPHSLRRSRPHRRRPLLPRRLLPIKLRPDHPSLRCRFHYVLGDPRRAHLRRGRPLRPFFAPGVPRHRGPDIPDPKRRIHLSARLVGFDSIRTHPPGPRRG